VVSYEEGEALAKEFKISFMETSAFNDINVEEVFMRITKDVHSRLESSGTSTTDNVNGRKAPLKQNKQTQQKNLGSSDLAAKNKRTSWCSVN
jgi:hypothetical protein